jgi:DNA-binding ferritin-like protein (Dps family)
VGIQDIIAGKKQWRAHLARVKTLPPDHQIVYKEIQRYLFKVGSIDSPNGRLLSGIVDFFEEGAAAGKGVLELIGNDVAAFCDDLVRDSRRPSGSRCDGRATQDHEGKAIPHR